MRATNKEAKAHTKPISFYAFLGSVVSVLFIALFGAAWVFWQYFGVKNTNDLIFQLLILGIVAVIALGIVSSFASAKITTELFRLVKSIETVNISGKTIDEAQFDIAEFTQIASAANGMIERLREAAQLESSKHQIEKLFASQDKFIKNAIHEINTPLAIIQANVELLQIKEGKSQNLQNIEAAAKIITNIYEDMSYFIRRDRIPHKKSLIDFSHYLLGRLEYFAPIAHGNLVGFDTNIKEKLFIHFDEMQLRRITDNNIYNAIKYATEGSDVKISLLQADGKIKLEVKNKSRQKIDENRVFDRFYKGESPRGGFGIGLHLVKEICQQNGVEFAASNEEESVVFRYAFDDFYESAFDSHGF